MDIHLCYDDVWEETIGSGTAAIKMGLRTMLGVLYIREEHLMYDMH